MGKIYEEFFSWLKAHSMEFRMRYDAMGWEIDYGYIKACDVVKAELEGLIEEHTDGRHGFKRD